MTGVALLAVTRQPAMVLPMAFVSHFVLDALPHYGQLYEDRKRLFRSIVTVDTILLLSLLVYGIVQQEWLWIAAGLAALSPDFVWIYRFIVLEKFGKLRWQPVQNRFNRFHAWIQKHEFKNGVYIEVAYLCIISMTVFVWT